MITATRRLQFCAGHRVFKHESKCANVHGHNYVLLFTARAVDLDSIGRVIDFSVMKTIMNTWLEKYWDHGFIYFKEDTEIVLSLGRIEKQKGYALPYNPTAENMAHYLITYICPDIFKGTGITISKIVLWETENCFAEVTL